MIEGTFTGDDCHWVSGVARPYDFRSEGDIAMRAEQGVTFVDLDAIAEKIDEKEEDDVENFVEALGISYATTEELRVGEKERERDVHRWELNPACAEDYISRTHTRN